MKIDVISVFPEIFESFLNTSIIKKAIDQKKIEINIVNLRDYSKQKHRQVDDTPYGGGAGMLLMFPPLYRAICKLKKKKTKVIMLSPQGEIYNQKKAKSLLEFEHIILLCGRYEGFDERIKEFVDFEISVGDYILMGGELPAMVVIESLARLVPGVIKRESISFESFENNLLEYPQYTKPANYKGYKVPDILLSGNHQKIDEWRRKKQEDLTKNKRPDLLEKK